MADPVTVVIPTLNRARLTAEAVDSVRALPRAIAQVIVVDTGSQSEELAALRRLVGDCWLVEGSFPNQAAARNAGASLATTEIVYFLDSDDRALPGIVDCLLPYLEADPAGSLAAGRVQVITPDGLANPRATATLERRYAEALTHVEDYEGVARLSIMYTSATLVRKSAFDRIGGYDESVPAGSEDWDLYLRLAANGCIRTLPCAAAQYRVWPNNTSWFQHALGIAEVAEKHLRGVPGVSAADRARADLFLRAHLVFSLHTMVRREGVRTEAMKAIRLHGWRAISNRSITRSLLGTILPRKMLAKRRPPLPE